MANGKPKSGESETPRKGVGVVGIVVLCASSVLASFAGAYLLAQPATVPSMANCARAHSTEVHLSESLVPEDFTIVALDELTISVGGGEASRFVKMQVSVVTSSKEVRSVEAAKPILLDAFSDYLRSVEPESFQDPAFYPYMKQQLARRAEIVLGSAGSNGVLVTEFLLR